MIRQLKTKQTLFAAASLALMAVAFTRCGSGNAPLTVLNSGDASVPELNLPLAITTSYGTYFGTGTVLTSSAQFTFGFNGSYGQTLTAVAPADGTIIDQTGTTITIQHSSRLYTRIAGVSTLVVRPGDYVKQGQALTSAGFSGVYGVTSGFTFQVILDGTVKCPWSFLSTTTRQQMVGLSGYYTSGVCIYP